MQSEGLSLNFKKYNFFFCDSVIHTPYVIFEIIFNLEILHPINTKSNKWNQNVINFLVRQKVMCSKIHILYILFTYVYKSFSTMLDKDMRKNIKKKKKKEEMKKLENVK